MVASSVAISSGRLRSAVGAGIFSIKYLSRWDSSICAGKKNKMCETVEYIKSVIANIFFRFYQAEREKNLVCQ